jgi:hypothetical protein
LPSIEEALAVTEKVKQNISITVFKSTLVCKYIILKSFSLVIRKSKKRNSDRKDDNKSIRNNVIKRKKMYQ